MTTILNKLFGTFLGVEFREDTLVLSFVKNSVSGMKLLSSATFPLKTDDVTLVEIRGYISQQGVKPDRVFVSIPDKWVITKFAEIPSIKGKGKDAVINLMRFEIERHIPFNLEEVSFDFLVLDEKDASYSVAFVAVHKEKMDSVKDFLEKLSLQPDAVIPSSFAVLNAVELSGVAAGGLQEVMGIVRKSKIIGKKSGTNMSLYFDGKYASMSVVKDGLYVHHRTLPYRIDEDPGTFVDEIAQYVAEMQSRYSVERLNTLILAGDLSYMVDAMQELKEKTGADIITLDKVSDFTSHTSREDINKLAASAGACFSGFGAATYAINLLPHKMELDRKKSVPLSTRIFLALILVLVIGIFSAQAVKRKQYLTKIETELKKNEPMIAAVEKLSDDMSRLQDRIDILRKLKNNEIALELLTEITGLLPKDAWITSFEYRIFELKDKKEGVGELVMGGFAASSSALIPVLEDSPYFEKVALTGPVKKAGDKEQFKLSALVALPEKKEGAGDKSRELKEESKDVSKNEEKISGAEKNNVKGSHDDSIPEKASR